MTKSNTLIKETTVKPLPPHIRKRLTFRSALLSDPRKYMNSWRLEHSPQRKPRPKKKKAPPKPVLENEETQTLDMSDAETNTKISRLSQMQCKNQKLKVRSAVAKNRLTRRSRDPSVEPMPEVRGILEPVNPEGGILIKTSSLSSKGRSDVRPVLPQFPRTYSDLQRIAPPVKRHRGILKKSGREVEPEGMCSQGTGTERKQPHLSRILKENHIFMKYSNSSKPKKKRVRVDKKPMFSYLSKKVLEKESVQSLVSSEDGNSRHVVLSDDVKCMSDASEDFGDSLERKPAQCVLEWTEPMTAEQKPAHCVLRRAPLEYRAGIAEPGGAAGVSLVVCHVTSAPQLHALDRTPLPPAAAPAPPRPPPAPPRPPPRKIPKERLYFRNMFFPACKR